MNKSAKRDSIGEKTLKKYIKVFGERNTGTNFTNELIRRNIEGIELLEHGNNNRVEEIYKQFPQDWSLLRERLIDRERGIEFERNFGWKHAFITQEMLMKSPRHHETLFVILIRNPFRFLYSLHRRPYNLTTAEANPTRAAFLQ